MVAGSRMSQTTLTCGSSANGSRTAVLSSGSSTMSDSLMPFQPAMEEPSNMRPSKKEASTSEAGKVTCCCLPRVSVKRRSTHFTSLSLISLSVFSDIYSSVELYPGQPGCLVGVQGHIDPQAAVLQLVISNSGGAKYM